VVSGQHIRAVLAELLAAQKLGILATHGEEGAYGSLVAFAAVDDLGGLLFATPRATRKYRNMQLDNRVALVIDSRHNVDTDFHEAVAATATGGADEATEPERAALAERYVAKHPYLADFVASPSCALFRLNVAKYYVVSRFQDVTILDLRA
jgi:nitroimidazol reductase NimA-like FMN-containing flavoprotein (pyridoxamine 5'-phosphate oxidase superfamily)